MPFGEALRADASDTVIRPRCAHVSACAEVVGFYGYWKRPTSTKPAKIDPQQVWVVTSAPVRVEVCASEAAASKVMDTEFGGKGILVSRSIRQDVPEVRKSYRLLSPSEPVKQGDEFYDNGVWTMLTRNFGVRADQFLVPFRREIVAAEPEKRYRLLNVGDAAQMGDELYNSESRIWKKKTLSGVWIIHAGDIPVRRLIE